MNVLDYPWSEPVIAAALVRQTFQRKCVAVVPNCNWTGHECDLLCVAANLKIIDVEIKITRADLRADAGKEKWWHRFGTHYAGRDESGRAVYHTPQPLPQRWPRRVWKHYYAMPASIWRPELMAELASTASGVILLKAIRHHENSVPVVYASVERRAIPNADARPLDAVAVNNIARLATLRLWDAYERLGGRAA